MVRDRGCDDRGLWWGDGRGWEALAAPFGYVDGRETADAFTFQRFGARAAMCQGNSVQYWLKNDNPCGGPTKIWRYQHFASYASFEQKRATLTACLKKVQSMASDTGALNRSAIQKLDEFRRLHYPTAVLRGVCSYMASVSGQYEWVKIRDLISTW